MPLPLFNIKNTSLHARKTVFFFGYSTENKHLFDRLKSKGANCIGIFDNEAKDNQNRIKGVEEGIAKLAEFESIDKIIISDKKIDREQIDSIIDYCDYNKIDLYILSDNNYPNKRLSYDTIERIIVSKLNPLPLDKSSNKIIKRTFDLLFSMFVIVFVLSWLYLICGLLIKLSSKGPIIFKQKRNGRDGEEFWCYKFRTMTVNELSDKLQATEGDKRITKFGAILRKTSLDETPQFINVLLGNMSVVGPRPHMIKHNEDYSKLIKNYNFRNKVKPGITGLAQVMGHRGATEQDLFLMKIRVRVDQFYIQNWTFGLDVKIVFLTIFEVIRPRKSTF